MLTSQSLAILISPTHRCNMRCEYCYVSDEQFDDISIADFSAAYEWIVQYCNLIKVKRIDFTWFGGEPLLFGVDNLEKALKLQNVFSKNGILYKNSIQSNLTLVDQKVCSILKTYCDGFISGSYEPFGVFRKFKSGNVANKDIQKKIDFLRRERIKVGAVSTLTKNDLVSPDKLFKWASDNLVAIRVNRAHPPNNEFSDKYLTVEEYNDYIIELIKYYINYGNTKCKFVNFFVIAHSILNKVPLACINAKTPQYQLAINGKGQITSYCRKNELFLGNYYLDTPEKVLMKLKSLPELNKQPLKCIECECFRKSYCSGACIGESNTDCLGSSCGYRTEFTKKVILFVDEYLKQNKITTMENLYQSL